MGRLGFIGFVVGFAALLCSSCHLVPSTSQPGDGTIEVDPPEIYDNSQLQTQLDSLRSQLASLGIVDTATLTASLGNVQGTRLTQSAFSLQALGRAGPSTVSVVPDSTLASSGTGYTKQTTQGGATAAIPAVPGQSNPSGTLPSLASDAIGLIDKQMQLESQLQGYQLLLGGSDFARYTIAGQVKDRVVIGFPITIYPQSRHRNMAAEVEMTYFPPNPNQFPEPNECEQRRAANAVNDNDQRFSAGDADNASRACREQEQTPTVINILPAERTYNVVGVAQRSTQFGASAVIGTVGLGASGGTNNQTQFLVAQQDTVALQGNGRAVCSQSSPGGTPPKAGDPTGAEQIIVPSGTTDEHCFPGSRGVRFRWQFRPVLGESFVRPGRRVTFVQLAIPNVRRPYPNYGGIVYIRTRWKPFDKDSGVVENAPLESAAGDKAEPYRVMNVLGHTFISSDVSQINATDLGGGSVLVSLRGSYLTGAAVRVGQTMFNPGATGFLANYNSLQFVTTVQALAQGGAYLVSAEGVESPVDLTSLCKSWDDDFECLLQRQQPGDKLQIVGISVLPVNDSNSLVKVVVKGPLQLKDYRYFHYARYDSGDVKGNLQQRTADTDHPFPISQEHLRIVNSWPVVLTTGGKAYGFSDLPFQPMSSDGKTTTLAVIASNDSINASPQVQVQRLFGNPEDDSDPQYFVPPGRVAVAIDPQWVSSLSAAAKKDKSGPCKPTVTCHYVISGADVEEMDPAGQLPKDSHGCRGPIELDSSSAIELNVRGLKVPGCARQIALTYPAKRPRISAQAQSDTAKSDDRPFAGEITLNLAGSLPTAPNSTTDAVPPVGTVAPHFQLVRAVRQITASSGLASLTVGIKNLKDQTATITVLGADIATAQDGSGSALPLQPGNQVMVSEDTQITFQVRNYTPKGVCVQAEGKNGGVSAGKLTFATAFTVTKDSSGSNPGGGNKTTH